MLSNLIDVLVNQFNCFLSFIIWLISYLISKIAFGPFRNNGVIVWVAVAPASIRSITYLPVLIESPELIKAIPEGSISFLALVKMALCSSLKMSWIRMMPSILFSLHFCIKSSK